MKKHQALVSIWSNWNFCTLLVGMSLFSCRGQPLGVSAEAEHTRTYVHQKTRARMFSHPELEATSMSMAERRNK